jgi:pimeloyl-ACP methyl ester carboxylesterase
MAMNDLDLIQDLEKKSERIEISAMGVQQVWHVWNKNAPSPIVLFHGGSGSWTHWVKNIQDLNREHAVWALDIPGFGDSELPPEAIDVDDLVPYVIAGLETLFKAAPVPLIGFSFGGLLAGFVAAQVPSCVSQLVLVGVPALGLTQKPLVLKGLRADMDEAAQLKVHRNNLEVMMIANANNITVETLHLQMKNVMRDRLKRRRIARGDIMLQLQTQWQCPVWGVWGEQDALYKGRLKEVQERLSGCDLRHFEVIKNAGHWVQYEAASQFNQLVLEIVIHSRDRSS